MTLDMTRTLQPARILLVDDSRAILAINRRVIEGIGYPALDLRTACDGEQALQMLERFEPDLVITDWHMPGVSGLELLQTVRQMGAGAPAVGFVTTEASAEQAQCAQRGGAAFFVRKPYTVDQLVGAITAVVPRQEAAAASAMTAGPPAAAALAGGASSTTAAAPPPARDPAAVVVAPPPATQGGPASSRAPAAPATPASAPRAAAVPTAIEVPALYARELVGEAAATAWLQGALGATPFRVTRDAPLKTKVLGLRNLVGVYVDDQGATVALGVIGASMVCILGGKSAALMPAAIRNAESSGRPSAVMVERCAALLERATTLLAPALAPRNVKLARHELVPQDLDSFRPAFEQAVVRADFRVEVPSLGDGRISFVVPR